MQEQGLRCTSTRQDVRDRGGKSSDRGALLLGTGTTGVEKKMTGPGGQESSRKEKPGPRPSDPRGGPRTSGVRDKSKHLGRRPTSTASYQGHCSAHLAPINGIPTKTRGESLEGETIYEGLQRRKKPRTFAERSGQGKVKEERFKAAATMFLEMEGKNGGFITLNI